MVATREPLRVGSSGGPIVPTEDPAYRRKLLETGVAFVLANDPKSRGFGLFQLNEYIRNCIDGGFPTLAKALGVRSARKLQYKLGGKGDPRISELAPIIAYCFANEGIPSPFKSLLSKERHATG